MIALIFISIFVTIFILGFIFVILNRQKYESELGLVITVIIYFVSEIIYFISFNLSTEILFDINLALTFWYISIITRNFSIGIFLSVHNLELNKDSKVRFLPILIYIFLGGIGLSLLFIPNSFVVNELGFEYLYLLNNIGLLTSIIIYNFCIVLVSWIIQIRGYKNYAERKLGNIYYIFMFLLNLSVLFYVLYLYTPNLYFKLFHSLLYLLFIGYFIFTIIKKPSLFAVFTNKIYDFIIFHKSGILLYSYNFQTKEEIDDNLLKGSILIGISHILSNLSNLETQVTYIKMEERAVVFNFDNQLSYAILLIAKHKNKILEKSIELFMKEFSALNKDSLKELSGLIDVSIFKNAKELIKQYFRHFITEK